MEILVGQRGQIVIPKRIREKYGIVPGRKVKLLEGKYTFSFEARSIEDELEETRKRWAALRRPVDPKLLREVLAMEPYDD